MATARVPVLYAIFSSRFELIGRWLAPRADGLSEKFHNDRCARPIRRRFRWPAVFAARSKWKKIGCGPSRHVGFTPESRHAGISQTRHKLSFDCCEARTRPDQRISRSHQGQRPQRPHLKAGTCLHPKASLKMADFFPHRAGAIHTSRLPAQRRFSRLASPIMQCD